MDVLDLTVLDLTVLDLTVLLHPREPALDDGQTSLSYQELAGAVDALRRRLAAAGIGVGDRVGVRLPSGTNDLYEAGPGNPLAPHSPGQPLR
ncbi:AMP-binding enzyme [Streptomyces sp. 2224.1]|nr:AMP-binding enzyme [Streptomyces sp. 2224.1]